MGSVGCGEEFREVGGGAVPIEARLAEREQRAGAALRSELRRRGATAGEARVHAGGEVAGGGAENVVEHHVEPPVGFAVEDHAGRHRRVEHLLEAEGLRAELNGIGGVGFGAAAFVFDREGVPRAIRLAVKLHDVGDAVDAERVGVERERAGDAEVAARFGAGFVGAFVEDAALGGARVLRPKALDVDERALARAEREVLQGGERKGVGLGHAGGGLAVAGVKTNFAPVARTGVESGELSDGRLVAVLGGGAGEVLDALPAVQGRKLRP